MKKNTLVIATRESPLAWWQANWVKAQLEKQYPWLSAQLLGLTTQADKILSTPLYKVGGKGLFVKELEEALLTGRADIAVHSMKDVPMLMPDGLVVPVICQREEVRDVLVSSQYKSLNDLPMQARIGTSSLRRQSQLLALRPDLEVAFLRGNVNTRLAKLDRNEYAAIVLAAAGLTRLDFAERIRAYFSLDELLPAAGQGALGIECRAEDEQTQALIAPLHDAASAACVIAERAMCRYLGGGCHVPIAAYAEKNADQLMLRGLVAKPDGTLLLRSCLGGAVSQADALGTAVAQDLLAQGAQAILTALAV